MIDSPRQKAIANNEPTYLGKLCARNHEFENSGHTLVDTRNSGCGLCKKELFFMKYHSDLKFRDRVILNNRKSAKKSLANTEIRVKRNLLATKRIMDRYNSDPEYREYRKAKMREYQKKRRQEMDDTANKLKFNLVLKKGTEIFMIADWKNNPQAWKYHNRVLFFVKETGEVSERFTFQILTSVQADQDIMALTYAEVPAAVMAQIVLNETP